MEYLPSAEPVLKMRARWLRREPGAPSKAMLDGNRLLAQGNTGRQRPQLVVRPTEIVLEAGANRLSRAGMRACLRSLEEGRRVVLPMLAAGEPETEMADLYLTAGLEVAGHTIYAVAERAAPALLILLGDRGHLPIRLGAEGMWVHVIAPHALDAALALRIVPAVAGIFVATIRDHLRGVLPDSLIRHRQLMVASTESTWVAIPQDSRDGSPVLAKGRFSLVPAETPDGRHLLVYAQESLTTLYLYAEEDVRRLAGEPPEPIRQAVFGETALPADALHATASKLGIPESHSRVEIGSHLDPVPIRMVVVETETRPRAASMRIARGLSRHPATEVVICPWHQIYLEQDAVFLRGDMLRITPGGAIPLHVPHDLPERVDALFFYGTATSGRPLPSTPGSLDARKRLARLGKPASEVDQRGVVQRMLHEASTRGAITNGVGLQGWWAIKDHLELMLRAYSRSTGRRVLRPRTVAAAPPQVPTVLRYFARRGLNCIIKPADGTQGEGLVIVTPDSPPPTLAPELFVVVQELIRNPFLVSGNKIDLRCYVLIDVDDEAASGRLPLVLVRRAGVSYSQGLPEAEIANLTYQRQHQLGVEIQPLHLMDGISSGVKAEIIARLDALIAELLRAHFWWLRAMRHCYTNPNPSMRVMIWGVDVLVSWNKGELGLLLLENNVYPQLFRDAESCDAAVELMFCTDYVPAVLRSLSRPRVSNTSAGQALIAV